MDPSGSKQDSRGETSPAPVSGKELPRIERPLTLVAQVERTLRQAIQQSTFVDGRLPTAVEFAEQLGVSRETVRLALDSLQREGLLVKRRRRGTFINAPSVPSKIHLARCSVLGYLQADYSTEAGEEETVTRPFSGPMFEGALVEAGRHGYQLIVRSARILQLRKAFDALNLIGRLRGAIFASVAEEKFLRRIAGLELPLVLVDHDLHLPNVSSVRGDSYQNARLAVEQLIGLGHRRIACAQWQQSDLNPWFPRGYREAMRDAGFRRRRAWEIHIELSPQGAAEVVDRLLLTSPRPTAVLCFHNTFAHHVIEAASRRGLHVPRDLSVFGGGGEEVVNLSCNQLDWYDLGRQAMRTLLLAIDSGETYQPEHRVVPYTARAGTTIAVPGSRS